MLRVSFVAYIYTMLCTHYGGMCARKPMFDVNYWVLTHFVLWCACVRVYVCVCVCVG